MFLATGMLAVYGLLGNRARLRELYSFRGEWVSWGLASAAILYLIFFAGDRISTALFDFAGRQVEAVYGTKVQASPWIVGALLLFWIGPCEEIFWRGFVQQRFAERFGPWKGCVVTSLIYAGIHLWAFNFMLFMAALICGLFWGWMFLKYKSVWPGLISHAAWDLTVFVLFPIR